MKLINLFVRSEGRVVSGCHVTVCCLVFLAKSNLYSNVQFSLPGQKQKHSVKTKCCHSISHQHLQQMKMLILLQHTPFQGSFIQEVKGESDFCLTPRRVKKFQKVPRLVVSNSLYTVVAIKGQ